MTDQPDLWQRIHDLLSADGEFIGCPAATTDAVMAVVQSVLDVEVDEVRRGSADWRRLHVERADAILDISRRWNATRTDRDRLANTLQRVQALVEPGRDGGDVWYVSADALRAALDGPAAAVEQTVCATRGREIEDRGDPSMDGRHAPNWVHVLGGGQICYPQQPDSPRAAGQ